MGPSNLFFNGHWGVLSPGMKRPLREVGNLFPSRAKIKKARNYRSISPICLHAVHRDNFPLQMKWGNTVRALL